MARMHVMEQSETQAIMSSMHEMLEKRLSVSSLAPCPVEFTASYVAMCATQSCGKCTPCRNGLRMLRHLFNDVLNNRATMETLDLIEYGVPLERLRDRLRGRRGGPHGHPRLP